MHSIFWSEHVTPRRRMGCAPYYAVTGTHPLLPFDIIEANYLLLPPDSLLALTDLIAHWAVALQTRTGDLGQLQAHVHQERNHAAAHFERDHTANIKNYDFKPGDLVLVWNTAIEKALNRKMQPRYTGPLVVVLHNRRGVYILCELDSTLLHAPFATFHIIPYFACEHIDILDIQNHIVIMVAHSEKWRTQQTKIPKTHSQCQLIAPTHTEQTWRTRDSPDFSVGRRIGGSPTEW